LNLKKNKNKKFIILSIIFPINYINSYDEMIKDAEKMIKQYINQYEYDIDYEFDVKFLVVKVEGAIIKYKIVYIIAVHNSDGTMSKY
jgi:hypothetical protein